MVALRGHCHNVYHIHSWTLSWSCVPYSGRHKERSVTYFYTSCCGSENRSSQCLYHLESNLHTQKDSSYACLFRRKNMLSWSLYFETARDHLFSQIQTNTHACMHTQTQTSMHTHTCIHTTCMHKHLHPHISHVYILHALTHTLTHTHTDRHTLTLTYTHTDRHTH